VVLALMLALRLCGREAQEDGRATARGRRVVLLVAPETQTHRRGNAQALRAQRLKLVAHAPRGSGQPLPIPR